MFTNLSGFTLLGLDALWTVLDNINWAVLILFMIAFIPQLAYVFLFFLKKRVYPEAKEKHVFGIVIAAYNEAMVIGDTVRAAMKQNYPADKIKVFVIADNCTDNTAEEARKAGAIVYERFDDKHRNKGYALNYGFDFIMAEHPEIESFIVMDADSLMHPDFTLKMNDAFESGVQIGRGYCNSKNLTDNAVSGVSGLYYIRDCRFTAHVRGALHTSNMLLGTGIMISRKALVKQHGFNCLTKSEDAEFTLKSIYAGFKIAYVPDAVHYDEQPTSLKNTWKRHVRMGHSTFRLFFRHAPKLIFRFFTRLRFVYLDMLLTMMFVPMALMACVWFPFYYIFDVVCMFITNDLPGLLALLEMIGYTIAFGFYLPFFLQTLLVVVLEKKKLVYNRFRNVLPAVFLFPFFMIFYAVAITVGALMPRVQWKPAHDKKMEVKDFIENVGGSNQAP